MRKRKAHMYPTNSYCLISLGGAMPSDDWRVTLHCSSAENLPITPDQPWDTFAAAVLTAFKTDVWSAGTLPLSAANGSGVSLSTCKVSAYNSGGVLAAQGNASISAVTGSSTTGAAGYQAIVATLLTGTFGSSYRGRMYLPWTGAVSTSTLQLTSSQTPNIAANVAAFLKAVNDTDAPTDSGDEFQPGVLSLKHGVITSYSTVRVDSVPDTQRGRQKSAVPVSTSIAPIFS
uniref:Uncharacterized protein n=1 Tax=uncultured prokaryote TaxID=198431 RepID=A0A0H5QND2_9ZZZZ|nr:hypothetical protein [uncultured prokaryote]